MDQALKLRLKNIIGELNDNSTVNPEYTRGQVELAMDLLGYNIEEADELYAELTEAANA